MRAIDVASGLPIGRDAVPGLPAGSVLSPEAALREVLRDALSRPPCVFSFSGGRDSSLLIAVATSVARQEGLPDPVPVTLVFPGVAESDEEDWQRLVLEHLGLSENWVRLPFADELGAVGPVAQEVLCRHGLVWPFNLHFHLPIVKLAPAGTLVTGFGGDEVARASRALYAERLIARRSIRRPHDLAVLGLRRAPTPIRFATYLSRNRDFCADRLWLTQRGMAALRVADAVDLAAVPLGWSRVLRDWLWRARYVRICIENFQVMSSAFDVRTLHPFLAAPVLQALAEAAPLSGVANRADLIRRLGGDLLPPELVTRRSKGAFTSPLWTDDAIEFARSWSGHGLDERFVDSERVRAEWLKPDRSLMATSLLQAAWLADNRRDD